MSRFILIKEYNSAYRPWIRAALKQKRIMGDREYSLRELEQMSMDSLFGGFKDELFQTYFYHLSGHKEYLPDYLSLLRLAVPEVYRGQEPNFHVIARLDGEARGRREKILLTPEDAAGGIHDFYENHLARPLSEDLEKGAGREQLLRYFEGDEFKMIPDNRANPPEKVDEVIHEIAASLLQGFREMTHEGVLTDITQVLDERYDEALAAAVPGKSYNHKSKYVHLSAHRTEGADAPTIVTLRPARGFGPITKGYEGALYPEYYVYPWSELEM